MQSFKLEKSSKDIYIYIKSYVISKNTRKVTLNDVLITSSIALDYCSMLYIYGTYLKMKMSICSHGLDFIPSKCQLKWATKCVRNGMIYLCHEDGNKQQNNTEMLGKTVTEGTEWVDGN